MNIVYLIGNGFDRNLGLRTSYRDFYNFYKKQRSSNENIRRIKEFIANGESELWSDLEVALGKISTEFNNPDDFIEILKDISDNLLQYIKTEVRCLTIETPANEKLKNYLCLPFDCLAPEFKRSAEEHFHNQSRELWNVNIITFNYTDVLEQILHDDIGKSIGKHHNNNAEVVLRSIQHIHGDFDSSIILGVNDTTQISNDDFRTSEDLLDWLVKSKTQENRADGVERKCKNLISEANLICVFGMSFGITDKLWWDSIISRLNFSPNTKVIIYEYAHGVSFNNNRIAEKGRYIRGAKKKLLSSSYQSLEGKVICDINTDMFNLKDSVKMSPIYDVRIINPNQK